MRIATFIAAALLALAAVPAVAGSRVETVFVDGLGRMPYEKLFEVVGEPGESLDAVAARAAPQLVAYSDETGFEACGVFATDGERYSVVVGTNHAHTACLNFTAKRVEGTQTERVTIHSHGKGAAKLTRSDMRFMGLAEDARTHKMHGTVWGQDREKFSEQDLGGYAGYLATPTGVLFHDGNHQVRTVAP